MDNKVAYLDGIQVEIDTYGIATVTGSAIGRYTLTEDAQKSITKSFTFRDPDDTTPPTVIIATPNDDANVTFLTEVIGTVEDDNLSGFQCRLPPCHSPFWLVNSDKLQKLPI